MLGFGAVTGLSVIVAGFVYAGAFVTGRSDDAREAALVRVNTATRAVAGALASCMKRPADLAARYGGEEFALVLPDTPQDGALVAANNARAAIEALGIGHRNSATAPVVTASFGVATMVPEGEDPMVLVERADASLYEAKKRGRNCVGSPG